MDKPGLRHVFRSWLRGGHLVIVDIITSAVVTATYLGIVLDPVDDGRPAFAGPLWLAVLVGVLLGVPLTLRRYLPLPVWGIVLAASIVSTGISLLREPFIAASIALYLVALAEPRRRSLPALLVSLGGALAALITMRLLTGAESWGALPGLFLLTGIALSASWTLGRAVRERRKYVARSAAQAAQQALTDERLRIARELHDIVAHSMSLIAVKAGIANHVAEARPGEARDALRIIEETSRTALNDMRRLLGVLRTEPGQPDDPPLSSPKWTVWNPTGVPFPGKAPAGQQIAASLDLAPAPGLAGLPELAERTRKAGVAVDLDVRGGGPLPQGVELSVYRIVQESLTNVTKHAGPARCRVEVVVDSREVLIEVTDDGAGGGEPGGGPPPPELVRGGGHGLVGMRERVMMFGGSFSAGPRRHGGFAVSARLPYEPTDAPGVEPQP